MKRVGIAVVWIFIFSGGVIAQEGASPDVATWEDEFAFEKAVEAQVAAPAPESSSANQLMFQYRMAKQDQRFDTMLLLSGTLVLSLPIILFFITRRGAYTAEHIVTASGLPFIIFGVIFLVLLADTDQQLTAGSGILGAVAGYLFRSMQNETLQKPATPSTGGSDPTAT